MMNANKWQLKAAAKGTVTTSSGWDGMTLVEVYNTIRKQTSAAGAMQLTNNIRDNRLHAMDSDTPHISQDQAFTWLLQAHVAPSEALRQVYGANVPQWAQKAVEAAWSKLNAEHRQALEDARMVA